MNHLSLSLNAKGIWLFYLRAAEQKKSVPAKAVLTAGKQLTMFKLGQNSIKFSLVIQRLGRLISC